MLYANVRRAKQPVVDIKNESQNILKKYNQKMENIT